MGFNDGKIVLDNPNGVYNAGDIINGQLVFDLEREKTFQALFVKVKGRCEVEWSSGSGRRRTTYSSEESYIEKIIYLSNDDSGSVTLRPGHYEYPFQFQIPASCPSSFSSKYGTITYKIKVVMDRVLKFNQEIAKFITVRNLKNLNLEPYCKKPMEFNFHEYFTSCCLSSGECELIVRSPVSGFCPGQAMRIDISCENKSSAVISSIVLSLKEEIIYHGEAFLSSDTKTKKEYIAQISRGPVPANTIRNWTVDMEIPLREVYNLDSCECIDIVHFFKVQMITPECQTDSSGSRRIVLGDIPLEGYTQNGLITNQEFSPEQQQSLLNRSYPSTDPNLYPIETEPCTVSSNLSVPFNASPSDDPSPPYPGKLPYPPANVPFQCNTGLETNLPPYPLGPAVGAMPLPYPTTVNWASPYAPTAPEQSTPESLNGEENKPL